MSDAALLRTPIPHGTIDDRRGTWAMAMFIATEAVLFVILFFTYFYLRHIAAGPWPTEVPTLAAPLAMLLVLVASSAVLHLGERAQRRGGHGRARLAVAGTVVLGTLFLWLQSVEYRERLRTLRPSSDAYGSIFYALTGVHGAHVLLGLLMLAYVLALPDMGPAIKPPHRPLHNVALYRHFVDAVWAVIVLVIYVAPNLWP